MAKKLETYKKRRNLKESNEPQAKIPKKPSKQPIFVIQKDEASRLHYDLRLEIGNVLVSWAIPKGPSTNPQDKRLAIRTDDHPMDYKDFEGIIPEGNYGAGTVMVWDYGTYKNIKTEDDVLIPMKQCLVNGQIEVWLDGHKIQGGYALIKTKFGGDGDNWLLVKMKDEKADVRRNPVSTQQKSALSERTMKEIAKKRDPQ